MFPLRSPVPQVTFHHFPRPLSCHDLEKKSPLSFAFKTKYQYSLLVALKFFLKFQKCPYTFSWVDSYGLGLYWIGLDLHGLSLTYLFGPFHYHLGPKIIFSVKNYPSRTIWPMSHVCMKKLFVCIKAPKIFFWAYFQS